MYSRLNNYSIHLIIILSCIVNPILGISLFCAICNYIYFKNTDKSSYFKNIYYTVLAICLLSNILLLFIKINSNIEFSIMIFFMVIMSYINYKFSFILVKYGKIYKSDNWFWQLFYCHYYMNNNLKKLVKERINN